MSYIDLLFPREELEALGNKWTEPATKRRKLDLNAGLARGKPQRQQQPVRLNQNAQVTQRRHTHSAPSQQRSKTPVSAGGIKQTIKRSNSDARLTTLSKTPTVSAKSVVTPKSCLPSFIEPSLLKNYLQHLHPNDRSRYSIPNSPEPEHQPQRSESLKKTHIYHEYDDDSCSPASLITDHSSSADNVDSCPTPTPGIYEQLHEGPLGNPFGYLLHGLRLTEHEKDLMENLLNPGQVDMPPPAVPSGSSSMKRKAGETDMGFDLAHSSSLDQPLIHRNSTISNFGILHNGYNDSDVHSSGLSPGPQEEEEDQKDQQNDFDDQPVMSTRGFAISVNDFFDLDEASGFTELGDD
ncbi:hypothetical protein LTR84_001388 [Exophiala bonariae]|uniref:Uncharacterized protein n=1 Tax=Exophiala bonariae TaxID=1690606 RepID=A0AAV9NC88_9EURO|nr:hypothetical protein LTR84_001388 [Exophiala bonariae]